MIAAAWPNVEVEPKADGAAVLVEVEAGDGEPKAEVAGFSPNALAPNEDAGALVVAAGDASLGESEEAAPSLFPVEAAPNPKPVDPKADAGLPLPPALLNAPNPKPLDGLEAAPKAGEGEEEAEVDPNAED